MERLYSNKTSTYSKFQSVRIYSQRVLRARSNFHRLCFFFPSHTHTHTAFSQNASSEHQNRGCFVPRMFDKTLHNWGRKDLKRMCAVEWVLLRGSVHRSQNWTCCADIKWGGVLRLRFCWRTGCVPLMKSSCSNTVGIGEGGVNVVQNEMIWIKPPDLFLFSQVFVNKYRPATKHEGDVLSS